MCVCRLRDYPGSWRKTFAPSFPPIQSDEVTPDRRFRARVDDAIREGLKALGYYEPTIEFDLRPPPKRGRQVLIAKVTPGEPVRIGGTEVILRGGARTDSDYLALLKTRPAIGTVLNHGDYDGFKSSLTRVALRKGYFDSEFLKSQLGVSLDRHQAFWDIDYDSGERYRFGHVTFSGSQIRDEYLQNLVPFKEGDYYTSQDLAELNRRLAATGWFSSVVVAPDFAKSRKTKVLPLQGVVSPRKENTVETGVGYSTDVGPRVKATWKKPWVNSYGHSLTSSVSLSAPEQQFDFTYKVPLLKSPLEQYYLMQGGFKRTDLNDTQADSTTLGVSRFWEMSSGWQRAIKPALEPGSLYPGERHQHHHADLSWGLGEPHSLPRRPDAYLGRFPALLGGLLQHHVGLGHQLHRDAGPGRLDPYPL
ncbi:surface antigen [Klebsiella pneumoniae]|nr:surface antigen [Klebsiella pneumoniae]